MTVTTKKGDLMKKIIAVGLALMTSTAFAQTYINNDEADYQSDTKYTQNMDTAGTDEGGATRVPAAAEGVRHMFEFNIDSIEAAAVSFDKIKTKGQSSDNESNIKLDLNYAYGAARLLQTAVRFNYFTGVQGSEDQENLGLSVGGILNSTDDFKNASYLSAYIGIGWAQQFGDSPSRDDLRFGSLSVGKRFALEQFGIKHVTYTPEVSLKISNSTTNESLDYSQSLQFKVLQFSVFF